MKPPAPPSELGWLPDLVYTGDKFEANLAFFVDALGRITRFSREPADLAMARRLAGQAALPGLVNAHSVGWQRILRGRFEPRRNGPDTAAKRRQQAADTAKRLSAEDVFDTARMVFLEMLLGGITAVGEFHELAAHANAATGEDGQDFAREILRAAHDVGIRIVLFNVATLRDGFGAGAPVGTTVTASADAFVKATESLRALAAQTYAADESSVGIAPESVATVPLEALKVIATYAHAQRLRVHARIAHTDADLQACAAEYGRSPLAVLADSGLIDKRFTAIHGAGLTPGDVGLLATARAHLCACPSTEHTQFLRASSRPPLAAAGIGIVLGTGVAAQVDLLKEARALDFDTRVAGDNDAAFGDAKSLLHAATSAGARSLGATGGALEVGRPADFFTVNLFDPSLAGATEDTLLEHVLFSMERRAIREVWIGARSRIAGGRHANQGPIVGRFVDLQRKLWPQ